MSEELRQVITTKPSSLVAALEGFYQFKREDDYIHLILILCLFTFTFFYFYNFFNNFFFDRIAITKPNPYPVIHPSPSVGMLVSSLRFKDYLAWGAITAAAIPTGLIMGSPMRIPTIKVCASIGLIGGLFYAVQNSYRRLAGFSENDSELRGYAFRPGTLIKVPIRQDPIPEHILQLAR